MKNFLVALLLVATVVLGALCLHERGQIAKSQAQLASAEGQLHAMETQLSAMSEPGERVAVAERTAKILQGLLTIRSAAAGKQHKQIAQLEQSLAEAKTNTAGQGLAGLLKDPRMKEMIKAQQKAVMVPLMQKQYAALFQQLNLSPETTAAVKDLMEKKMLVATDMGTSMLGGDMDASKRAELGKQMKSETDACDEQIKQLLGEDNYATLKTYEQSVPDRLSIGQIRDQLAGTPTALSAPQEEQLIQAMQEVRSGFKWTTDSAGAGSPDANVAEMFNENRLNQFAQDKAQFDQQVLVRAKQILPPEQLAAFQQSQTALREMQINTMKLAAGMLAPKSS